MEGSKQLAHCRASINDHVPCREEQENVQFASPASGLLQYISLGNVIVLIHSIGIRHGPGGALI